MCIYSCKWMILLAFSLFHIINLQCFCLSILWKLQVKWYGCVKYTWVLLFYIYQGRTATRLRCGGKCYITMLQISCRVHQWQNFWNCPTFAKVMNECTVADGNLSHISTDVNIMHNWNVSLTVNYSRHVFAKNVLNWNAEKFSSNKVNYLKWWQWHHLLWSHRSKGLLHQFNSSPEIFHWFLSNGYLTHVHIFAVTDFRLQLDGSSVKLVRPR